MRKHVVGLVAAIVQFLLMNWLLANSYLRLVFVSDTANSVIYPLSLHDALPISSVVSALPEAAPPVVGAGYAEARAARSEEHTSELQSPVHRVCRLRLEKKTIIEYHPP